MNTGYIETPIQTQAGQPMFKVFLYETGNPTHVGFSCATFHRGRWQEYERMGVERKDVDGMVKQVMFYAQHRTGTGLGNGFPADIETILGDSDSRTPLPAELFAQVRTKLAEQEKAGLIKIL
jgi:hypothetical protein